MALILIKFGSDREIAKTLLKISEEGDNVLFIQDGVLWALDEKTVEDMGNKKVNLYAVKEDLEARGYTQRLNEGISILDYDGVIDLIEKNEKIIG